MPGTAPRAAEKTLRFGIAEKTCLEPVPNTTPRCIGEEKSPKKSEKRDANKSKARPRKKVLNTNWITKRPTRGRQQAV